MSKFETLPINYPIATGDAEFAAVQVEGGNIMITVGIAGIDSSDASVELQQSIENATWGLIPDSLKVLSIGQPSHTWNVRGLVRGAFIRVAVKKGTASAGTITNIKVLSNE